MWPLRSQYPFLISPREHHLHFFFFRLWVGEVGCVCITHTTGAACREITSVSSGDKVSSRQTEPSTNKAAVTQERRAGGQTEEASVGISRPGTSKRVAGLMGPVGSGRRLVQRRKLANDNERSDLDELSPPSPPRPDMSETRGRGRHHGGGVSCWGLTLARHSLQYGSV